MAHTSSSSDAVSLKALSKDAVPAALAKAERYRLLNEPSEAESICLDVLQVDPGNRDALVTLILALTDQFPLQTAPKAAARAGELVSRLPDEYDRAYYSGIILERRAKAVVQDGRYGAAVKAMDWLRDAMNLYERAEAIRPAHNDDALLRWNACARLRMELPERPRDLDEPEPLQLE